MVVKPVVALVGRPNVGKSTLFNRLVGEPLAIVDDVPGTTRDRLMAEALWNGKEFDVIDTGGIDPVTASNRDEPLSIGSADFITDIRTQAEIAIQEADAVLFVVDAISGVTPRRPRGGADFAPQSENARWSGLASGVSDGQQGRQRQYPRERT